MAIPSFSENLARAREIAASMPEAGGMPRGELIANGVSDFVSKILGASTGEKKTYIGSLQRPSYEQYENFPSDGSAPTKDRFDIPGGYHPYQQPIETGGSVLDVAFRKLFGAPGFDSGSWNPNDLRGGVPVDQKTGAEFMAKSLIERDKLTRPIPASLRGAIASGFDPEYVRSIVPDLGEGEDIPIEEFRIRERRSRVLQEFGTRQAQFMERERFKEGKIPTAEAGRLALAEESEESLDKDLKILFPSGKPESFRRDIAAAASVPGFRKALPFSREGQEIRRLIKTSLAGRQLIQTGVAANPVEMEDLIVNFIPGITSDSHASFNAMTQLRAFYPRYRRLVEGRGRKEGTGNVAEKGKNWTEEELLNKY